jgi:hypothetical protein
LHFISVNHLSIIAKALVVYTDFAISYGECGINEFFLHHSSVNHRLEEYVRGNVHTNNIECFWSVLKRTVGGTYTHVNPTPAPSRPIPCGASVSLRRTQERRRTAVREGYKGR